MGRLQTLALRSNANKRAVPNRSKDPLEPRNFLKEWRHLLSREGAAWEGEKAVRELKEKEVFQFLNYRPEDQTDDTNWNAEVFFDEMLDEMQRYRNDATNRLIKEYFKEINAHLTKEMEWTKKQTDAIPFPDMKKFLRSLTKDLIKARQSLHRVKRRRDEWPFGLLNRIETTAPIHNVASGLVQLDSRLQVKLGQLFGSYLFKEDVSVETVARLVLLAYCAGKLAELDDKEKILRTTYTGRKLQKRNIRDALDSRRVRKELFDS